MWAVRINHWKIGRGYTHSEELEILEKFMTAEEWFKNFQDSSDTPFTIDNIGDGINVEIWNLKNRVSEFFVDEDDVKKKETMQDSEKAAVQELKEKIQETAIIAGALFEKLGNKKEYSKALTFETIRDIENALLQTLESYEWLRRS